jgi:ADP-L-glycero-D-manno-heptose 6-epimerase
MRAYVTGWQGFIGSNLVKHLTANDCDVVLADWEWSDPRGNVCFHLAANTDPQETDPAKMFEPNVFKAIRLFEKCKARGMKIVYASSCAVYGNTQAPLHEETPCHPLTPYAKSKLALDMLAPLYSAIGVRFTNVYGPGEEHKGRNASMISQIAWKVMAGEPVTLFKNGEQCRDYIHVDDVCRALSLLADKGKPGVYVCGSGRSYSFNQIAKCLGVRAIEYVDNPFRGTYQENTFTNPGKLNALGWLPDQVLNLDQYDTCLSSRSEYVCGT